jgi:hypothetical protein
MSILLTEVHTTFSTQNVHISLLLLYNPELRTKTQHIIHEPRFLGSACYMIISLLPLNCLLIYFKLVKQTTDFVKTVKKSPPAEGELHIYSAIET